MSSVENFCRQDIPLYLSLLCCHVNHGIQAFNHLIVRRDVRRSKVKWYQEFPKCCFKNKMLPIFYLNHHTLVISHKLCVEHNNKQQNRKLRQTFGSNPLTWVYSTIGCNTKYDGYLLICHPWVSLFPYSKVRKSLVCNITYMHFSDQFKFLGNCAPTPPPSQH